MDFRDIVEMALEECKGDLYQALEGLTSEELTWQPGPESNPIGFLAWHIARDEDRMIQHIILNRPDIWERDGWCERLGLPREGSGYGYTAEQVASFPMPDIKDILAYFDAVRSETLQYLRSLDAGELERCPMPDDRPGYTVGRALSHLVVEESQHMGQVGYLRGLQRGIDK